MTPQFLETVTTRARTRRSTRPFTSGAENHLPLFLGGIVAGTFVLTAALRLRHGARPISRALRPTPFVALALCR